MADTNAGRHLLFEIMTSKTEGSQDVPRPRLTSVESHNPVSYRQTDRHTYRQTNRQADTQLRCRTASHLLPRFLLSRLASSRPTLQKLTLKTCRDQDCQVSRATILSATQTDTQTGRHAAAMPYRVSPPSSNQRY